jgi:short-subunit dehydrogenase
MKSFKNKVAAITGAGSGIGRALAAQLAAQNCALALSDIDEKGLSETAARIRKASDVKITTHKLDVADRGAVEAWAAQVAKDHGGVNLLFNNAGVALGASLEDVSYEDFEWIVSINFWGVVYGTKAFLPYMRKSGEGHIVNLSSLFGLMSLPSQGAYNATKFAVRGFTESLRQELDVDGGQISATSVHPGGIKTNIAKSARFDASTSKMTGQSAESSKVLFERLFITSADQAAATILKAVKKNQRRVLVGPDAKLLDLLVRLAPSGYQAASKFAMKGMKRFAKAKG